MHVMEGAWHVVGPQEALVALCASCGQVGTWIVHLLGPELANG